MKKHKLLVLLMPLFFTACMGSGDGDYFDDDYRDDAQDELTEFGEMLQEKFEEEETPYDCNINFDNYEAENFLSRDEWEMLELYMVFYDGFMEDRYAALDRIELESGVTMVVVTSKDSPEELSTYVVTYGEDEYYVKHLQIGYENTIIEMKMYSTLEEDKVTRTDYQVFDGEEIIQEEIYYITEEGDIIWEEDMIE